MTEDSITVLKRVVGKRVAATACERDSSMGPIYAARITFDDGSVLNIDIDGGRDDAWLLFEHTEGTAALSAETKAELDGPSWAHGTRETNPHWPYEGPAQGWVEA